MTDGKIYAAVSARASGEPFICTREAPWTPDVEAELTLHPVATAVGLVMRCPNCGYEWEREPE